MTPRPAGEPDKTSYRGRFAARLRELRSARFETPEAFAIALTASLKKLDPEAQISRATAYSWESGSRFPDPDTLPIIAKHLGVSVGDLFPKK